MALPDVSHDEYQRRFHRVPVVQWAETLDQIAFGPVEDPAYTTVRIMARSIVKYAPLLARYLADLPGRMPKTWTEAAERLCGIPV